MVDMAAVTAVVTRHAATATALLPQAIAPRPAPTDMATPAHLAAMVMLGLLADTAMLALLVDMPQLLAPTQQPRAATATVAAQECPLAVECAAVVVVAQEGAASPNYYMQELQVPQSLPAISGPALGTWDSLNPARKPSP